MAFSYIQKGDNFGYVFGLMYLVIAIMYGFFYKDQAKLIKQVSYTDTHLYVYDKDQSTEIPLENIREVELTTLDGLYKFSFYRERAPWKEIYCKVSMWYPFNYKKVDEELDLIRRLIRKRTMSLSNDIENRLPSGQ